MISAKDRASWQRSATCWIKGLPAIKASGFPGNREEPYRAGMIPTIRTGDITPRPAPLHSINVLLVSPVEGCKVAMSNMIQPPSSIAMAPC
jgi:hypothetical protein